MRRASVLGVLLLAASGGIADGQEIVEIDSEAGRIVLADTLYRSMIPATAVVDWTSRLVYVRDREEPEGIMVFSLNDGEWVPTVSTPRGDGPGEFAQGLMAFTVAPHGGLYASGLQRVVEHDSSGIAMSTWVPQRPPTRKVFCDRRLDQPDPSSKRGALRWTVAGRWRANSRRSSTGQRSSAHPR